jgi:hypothetical protein
VLIDDPYLQWAFSQEPTYLRKLHDFACRYALHERTALYLQARALTGHFQAEVRVPAVRAAMADSGTGRDEPWDGFGQVSVAPGPCFEGLCLVSARESPEWATEVHQDGHVCAGLWRFPTLDAAFSGTHAQSILIPAGYRAVFADFGALLKRVAQALDTPCGFAVTATLALNGEVVFADRYPPSRAAASRSGTRPLFQWPVLDAPDAQRLDVQLARMAGDFDALVRSGGR